MTAIGSKEPRTVCCRAQRSEPANATGLRELANDRDHKLSVKRQAALLGISRGSVYYLPREVPETDLALMLRDLLAGEGMHAGRLHISTLMKRMGIEALYRKPNTSKPEPGHKIYPYLLRNLAVTRPNQVWAIDITYVPMAKGFVYLVAVVDWFSRRVLAWRLSITMEMGFCIEAVEEAIGRYGCPEIFNSDQGSQFTSIAFTKILKDRNIEISMDGRGAWKDNVFVERLWRSIKYEEIYRRAYASVPEARAGIGR